MSTRPIRHTAVAIARRATLCCAVWVSLAVQTTPAGAADADDAYADLDLAALMKVAVDTVYGASRYMQKVTQAPASISIITADEIRRQGHRTLADVLRGVRGVYITNDRNYDNFGIRGFAPPGDYTGSAAHRQSEIPQDGRSFRLKATYRF